ncbi:DUF4326 domain-containing protein [Pararhodospirillum photometricum]|uniref:DUF4326 domain-containing protein n=1 Tax=Pararhodospirillum photometricum TaxID=1084 RepID=UPI00059EEE87|nr:DUF4326 domain-containing protein [Pararhodospirillum photometricum]
MTDRPARIQRLRAKGWRMPPDTVYVGRPTIWGNHFVVDPSRAVDHPDWRRNVDFWSVWPVSDAATAVQAYREMVLAQWWFQELIPGLRGRNLACWCPLDQPCHADVLLEIANSPIGKDVTND